jgi:signal transduction histidine kinase
MRSGAAVTSEEWVLETPQGDRIPILLDAGPIRAAAGEITGAVLAWQDISGRKRLEQDLLRARQMEAIGFLAGGVAHEFNNMLTVISGHCQLLLEGSRSPKVREHMQPVLEAAQRLTSLTAELLGLAGRQMTNPGPVCLNSTIRRMRDALQQLVGSSYVITTEFEPALGKVQADQGLIEHIIMSLVLHARDAMPEGGTIEITTRKAEVGSGETAPCCHVPPGRYSLLVIRDTSPGLDKETAEHLFEPFLGGKGIGKGAGLGLSSVYGAVRQNHGDIRLTSEPGKGTTFQICLPEI